MGFTNLINNSIKTAFNVIGDLNTGFTLCAYNKTYDANTASYIVATSNTVFEKGFISDFTKDEIKLSGGSIKISDKKLIFPNPLNVVVSTTDKISINSELYNIEAPLKKEFDLQTLQLRK